MHLIQWSKICSAKINGGLGVGFLHLKNDALLSKWWWKFNIEKDKLWRQILSGKYGLICLYELRDECLRGKCVKASPFVKSIISVTNECFVSCCAKNNFSWNIGKGDQIEFWIDRWHNSGILKVTFKELYQKSIYKNIRLNEAVSRWSQGSLLSLWVVSLSQAEVAQVERIQSMLKDIVLSPQEDRLIWKGSSSQFSASVAYDSLTDNNNNISVPYWNSIWCLKFPARVKMFLWQCGHNILPTLSFLNSRILLPSEICQWCGSHIENLEHLLFSCSLAEMGWQIFSSWLGIDVAIFNNRNVLDLFSIIRIKYSRECGGLCLAALLWSLWLARNDLVFNNNRTSRDALQLLIKFRAYSWAKANNLVSPNVENLWVLDPGQCAILKKQSVLKSLMDRWFSVYPFLGFIDGSYLKKGPLQCSGGIGGFLIDKRCKVKLLFSGPVEVTSGFEAELAALLLMLYHLSIHNLGSKPILVFSDSCKLVYTFLKYKSGNYWDRRLQPFDSSELIHNISLLSIPRYLNSSADWLSKQGAKREKMVAAWF